MSTKLVLTLAMLSLLLVGKAGVLADHALQTTQPLTQSQAAVPWYQTQVNDLMPRVDLDAAQTMTETNDLDNDHDLNDDHDTPDTDKEVDDNADETAAPSQPVITLAAAQQAAEAYVHAGRATKVELEQDDGQWIYQVRINNVKVEVDAFTGRVLKAKVDD